MCATFPCHLKSDSVPFSKLRKPVLTSLTQLFWLEVTLFQGLLSGVQFHQIAYLCVGRQQFWRSSSSSSTGAEQILLSFTGWRRKGLVLIRNRLNSLLRICSVISRREWKFHRGLLSESVLHCLSSSRFTIWQTTYFGCLLSATGVPRCSHNTHSTHDVVKSVPDFWHFLKRINGWPSLRYCLLQALSCMYTQSKCVKWSFHRAAKSYLLRRLTGKSQVAEKSHFISFSQRNISIKDWLKFHFWRADRKFLKNAPFLFCCSCSNENGNVSFFS